MTDWLTRVRLLSKRLRNNNGRRMVWHWFGLIQIGVECLTLDLMSVRINFARSAVLMFKKETFVHVPIFRAAINGTFVRYQPISCLKLMSFSFFISAQRKRQKNRWHRSRSLRDYVSVADREQTTTIDDFISKSIFFWRSLPSKDFQIFLFCLPKFFVCRLFAIWDVYVCFCSFKIECKTSPSAFKIEFRYLFFADVNIFVSLSRRWLYVRVTFIRLTLRISKETFVSHLIFYSISFHFIFIPSFPFHARYVRQFPIHFQALWLSWARLSVFVA